MATDGPYRCVCHPSYLGGLISAAGFGLALGSWLAAPVTVAFNLIGIVRRIHVEEATLRDGLVLGPTSDTPAADQVWFLVFGSWAIRDFVQPRWQESPFR